MPKKFCEIDPWMMSIWKIDIWPTYCFVSSFGQQSIAQQLCSNIRCNVNRPNGFRPKAEAPFVLLLFCRPTAGRQFNKTFFQWKGIDRKQSTRWQHLSRLKASAFFSLQISFSCNETQQLILGTGTAIWWVTEPHSLSFRANNLECPLQAFLIWSNIFK